MTPLVVDNVISGFARGPRRVCAAGVSLDVAEGEF